MQIYNKTIIDFFDDLLIDLNCHQETRAYIVSIYGKYKNSEFDLSKDSITLLFAQARQNQDFLIYQNLGDWIFYVNSLFSLNEQNKSYYDTIARLSYYSCYRLINRQWLAYEELADNFIYLENEVRHRLRKRLVY